MSNRLESSCFFGFECIILIKDMYNKWSDWTDDKQRSTGNHHHKSSTASCMSRCQCHAQVQQSWQNARNYRRIQRGCGRLPARLSSLGLERGREMSSQMRNAVSSNAAGRLPVWSSRYPSPGKTTNLSTVRITARIVTLVWLQNSNKFTLNTANTAYKARHAAERTGIKRTTPATTYTPIHTHIMGDGFMLYGTACLVLFCHRKNHV